MERSYVRHDDESVCGFEGPYRFLSNYHECWILWHGMAFSSVESAYQASKTSNIEVAKQFQDMTPLQAKQHGKRIKARKEWRSMRIDVMAQLVFQKFLVHPDLRTRLLATGDRRLEETNWWGDRFWGVCNETGENNLGRLLMATRAYFRALEQ